MTKNKISFYRFRNSEESFNQKLAESQEQELSELENKLERAKSKLNKYLHNNSFKKPTDKEKEFTQQFIRDLNAIQNQETEISNTKIDKILSKGEHSFHVQAHHRVEEFMNGIAEFSSFIYDLKLDDNEKDILSLLKDGVEESKKIPADEMDAFDRKQELFNKEELISTFFTNKTTENILNRIKKSYDIGKMRELIEKERNYNEHSESKKKIKEFISKTETELNKIKGNPIHDRIDSKDIESFNLEIHKMNKEGWAIKQIEGIQSGVFDYGKLDVRFGKETGFGYGYGFTEGIMVVWEKDD